MAANYVLLEKIVVGAAGASSVTFSGIPQTGYTDLVIKASTRDSSSAVFDDMVVSFNGSTASMTRRFLESTNGTSAGSGAQSNSDFIYGSAATATANTFGNSEMYIPNYTSSNYKSLSVDNTAENNATAGFLSLLAGLWSNTAAITSITLTALSGSFVQYSTFYLYGVAALGTTPAIQPYATGGDTIMTDGTYWYHAFKSSGTFTPTKALSCDVLVVAGGGSGGFNYGGGGGAGGVFYATAQSLASGTGYTATVGAGGAQAYATVGNNGSNSTFASLTAAVGGGGGGAEGSAAKNGGSGGGGIGYDRITGSPFNAGGTSTQTSTGGTGYGYAGGTGAPQSAAYDGGGGGGGAGAIGGNNDGTSTGKGDGGVGTSAFSSWGSVTGTGQNVSGTYYFAGGGGNGAFNAQSVAGAGGNGGGGRGSTSGGGQTCQTGTANTGGGGGGNSNGDGSPSNAGGSGIVIVRYAV